MELQQFLNSDSYQREFRTRKAFCLLALKIEEPTIINLLVAKNPKTVHNICTENDLDTKEMLIFLGL